MINCTDQTLTSSPFRSKSGQQYYLDGIESIVVKHPVFMEIFPKILHALYDEDVLSDSTILNWNKKLTASGSPMVARLEPLITWLEQSDSESESESD